jgi:hypothetical protein
MPLNKPVRHFLKPLFRVAVGPHPSQGKHISDSPLHANIIIVDATPTTDNTRLDVIVRCVAGKYSLVEGAPNRAKLFDPIRCHVTLSKRSDLGMSPVMQITKAVEREIIFMSYWK